MDTTQRAIYRNLRQLAQEYNELQDERDFLMNGVAARLAEVNADRQAIVAEANVQLDRLNTLLVAAGQEPMTLQQVRDSLKAGPRRPIA